MHPFLGKNTSLNISSALFLVYYTLPKQQKFADMCKYGPFVVLLSHHHPLLLPLPQSYLQSPRCPPGLHPPLLLYPTVGDFLAQA